MIDTWDLRLGDCVELLAELPADSVEAIVTDPPYGIEFMGREWDTFKGAAGPGARAFQAWCSVWGEQALRVLKPGGHLLAFGASRTYHRLATGLEEAGFEIRDSLAWIYGTGFPKSLDVSKALDKRRDDTLSAERRAIILRVTDWVRQARDAACVTNPQIDALFGYNGMAGHWTSAKAQPSVPTAEQWPALLELFGVEAPPDEVREAIEAWLAIKGQPAPTWFLREVTGHHEKPAHAQEWKARNGIAADLTPKERRDNPATPEAVAWAGWGTALKPSIEPVVMARKPFRGNVATNVLRHGTGAVNVGACLLEGDRWPPNVMLDEAAAELLEEANVGAARFMYCAKPAPSERHAGLERVGGDEDNKHPTVKPVDVMTWLCRLVTPPGGLVLDPFTGSGTTGIAALRAGFRFLGFERDPVSLEVARLRIRGDAPLFR